MNDDTLHAARLRYRAIVESGVDDPINAFLTQEGLVKPTTQQSYTLTYSPPKSVTLPAGWRMPTGQGGYPFGNEKYRLPGLW